MIRLGVIGYGTRIRKVIQEIDRYNAGTRIIGLVDPQGPRLKETYPALADAILYPDADRMLDTETLDGILIGTRCFLHTPYALKVLARGLPLWLEKPVAITWEQLAELRTAMERSSSPVVVSFPLRLSAMCQAARRIIDSGAIGSVQHVQAVNNVPFYGVEAYYHGWYRDETQTGGLWFAKTTHDFDYINFLVGQTPQRLCAVESKTVFRGEMPAGLRCVDCSRQAQCPESPFNLYYQQGVTPSVEPNEWLCSFAVDTGNHDSASAIIQYPSGLHVSYTQNFYSLRGAASRGATLIGYEGTIKFDWYQNELVVYYHHASRVERHRFDGGEGHHGGDKELAHDFLSIVTGTGTSRSPLDAGLVSSEMCLMARESCHTAAFQEFGRYRAMPAG